MDLTVFLDILAAAMASAGVLLLAYGSILIANLQWPRLSKRDDAPPVLHHRSFDEDDCGFHSAPRAK